MAKDEVRSFFEILDWTLKLTPNQALQFRHDLADYEKEQNVAYISSIEQIGLDRGLEQGLEQGEVRGLRKGILAVLQGRFGIVEHNLAARVESLDGLEYLKDLMAQAVMVPTVQEFEDLLNSPRGR